MLGSSSNLAFKYPAKNKHQNKQNSNKCLKLTNEKSKFNVRICSFEIVRLYTNQEI